MTNVDHNSAALCPYCEHDNQLDLNVDVDGEPAVLLQTCEGCERPFVVRAALALNVLSLRIEGEGPRSRRLK